MSHDRIRAAEDEAIDDEPTPDALPTNRTNAGEAEYELSAKVTVSCYTKIVAHSLEEAIQLAADRNVTIAGDGFSNEHEEWIVGDCDGSAQEIAEA